MPAGRAAALLEYKKLIGEVSTQLHPEDVDFEPLNFTAWMESCDECDAGLLASMIAQLRSALKSALLSATSGNTHSALYVRVREPFLTYAVRAQARRFGAVPDEHSESPA